MALPGTADHPFDPAEAGRASGQPRAGRRRTGRAILALVLTAIVGLAATAIPADAARRASLGRWQGDGTNGGKLTFVVGYVGSQLVFSDPVASCGSPGVGTTAAPFYDTFGESWTPDTSQPRANERRLVPIRADGSFVFAPFTAPRLVPGTFSGRLAGTTGRVTAKARVGAGCRFDDVAVKRISTTVRKDGIYEIHGSYLTSGTASVYSGGGAIIFDNVFGGPPEPRITEQLGPAAGMKACTRTFPTQVIVGGPDGGITFSGGFASFLDPVGSMSIAAKFTGRNTIAGLYSGATTLQGQTFCPLVGALAGTLSVPIAPELKFRAPRGDAPRKPKRKPQPCVRVDRTVTIDVSRTRFPQVAAHIRRAVRTGWPRELVLNRPGADARRNRALREVPTRPGFDRDEYPPAFLRGHGSAALRRGSDPVGWKASVTYVTDGENRAAGSSQQRSLSRYCNGQRVRLTG